LYGPDLFKVKILYPQIFVSEESGLTLADTFKSMKMSPDSNQPLYFFTMIGNIPKQLLAGVNIELLKNASKTVEIVINSVVVAQIIVQLFLKIAMNDLWSLYFTL